MCPYILYDNEFTLAIPRSRTYSVRQNLCRSTKVYMTVRMIIWMNERQGNYTIHHPTKQEAWHIVGYLAVYPAFTSAHLQGQWSVVVRRRRLGVWQEGRYVVTEDGSWVPEITTDWQGNSNQEAANIERRQKEPPTCHPCYDVSSVRKNARDE